MDFTNNEHLRGSRFRRTLPDATSVSASSSCNRHGVAKTSGTSYPANRPPAIRDTAEMQQEDSAVLPIKSRVSHGTKPNCQSNKPHTINSKDTVTVASSIHILIGQTANANLDTNTDDEHTDDEHTDDEHTDDEHTDDEHTDDEHTDDEYTDDEHTDDEHTDDEDTPDEDTDDTPDEDSVYLIRQLEAEPIHELKDVIEGIYADLVRVEQICIEVDAKAPDKLRNEEWQALIDLHYRLLDEHYDLLVASQHPVGDSTERELVSKRNIPARMWLRGIHSLLDLLRHRLPASREHMLRFIPFAFSMVAHLCETVPTFLDHWIECLGDLGQYRKAIEAAGNWDWKHWGAVSFHWYTMASDMNPTTGRLYHHLAIVSGPNALQELFYFLKSLCVPVPFVLAKKSIMTVIGAILSPASTTALTLAHVELYQLEAVSLIFMGREQEVGDLCQNLLHLDSFIAWQSRKWLQRSYQLAIIQCCAMVGCDNRYKSWVKKTEVKDAVECPPAKSSELPRAALKLFCETYRVVSLRSDDHNVFPYIHCALAFLLWLSQYDTFEFVAHVFPWDTTIKLLRSLLVTAKRTGSCEFSSVPPEPCRLPEDYALRGLPWAVVSDSQSEFSQIGHDENERYLEVASHYKSRSRRILWLGNRIYQNHPRGPLKAVYKLR